MNDKEKEELLLQYATKLCDYNKIDLCEEIKSHRRITGRIVILLKRMIRKSIVWFIRPIVNRQNDINNKITQLQKEFIETTLSNENNVTDRLSDLLEKSRKDEEKIVSLEKEMVNFEEKILKLEELNFSFSRLEEIDKRVCNIEDTFNLELLGHNDEFFNKKSYSQSGEDTIIAYIFNYLAIDISKIKYLDLGANHAKMMSNTYYFYQNGANGVLVEANPSLIPELHFHRHNDIILNNLISTSFDEELDFYILSGDGLSTPDKKQAEETCIVNPSISIENIVKVKSITVDKIFEMYFGDIAPDFISIDIEGYDLEIIKSIDFEKYRPLVLVVEAIEYRPYLPINVKVTDILEYLQTQDYVEYAFTGINSIFIDARYMKKLNQDK
ncbi:FkbM family methyltransferase [Clostridium beijerinckii]|nr:FkbM family methyltransferase [Clostridium beijerinckii]MZK53460.1 hypothetical protein [Clostridium beijerinckii]MZK61598.1 hypothetical protein [Clostridium beijerinckii]MZK71884.1 hypothetical protein [Clostridium beijerinckii]MZK77227.1 hypothetical protein [Clostridium beijerinckii]MZK86855.1 hypothetical protein [Clostridium beijerinckii]